MYTGRVKDYAYLVSRGNPQGFDSFPSSRRIHGWHASLLVEFGVRAANDPDADRPGTTSAAEHPSSTNLQRRQLLAFVAEPEQSPLWKGSNQGNSSSQLHRQRDVATVVARCDLPIDAIHGRRDARLVIGQRTSAQREQHATGRGTGTRQPSRMVVEKAIGASDGVARGTRFAQPAAYRPYSLLRWLLHCKLKACTVRLNGIPWTVPRTPRGARPR